jgi:phage-related protein
MNITTADYIFLILAIGLLVLMLFLYRKTKKTMKTNIKEILEEYKELKRMASELHKDAENIKEQSQHHELSVAEKRDKKENDDYILREYMYEIRQKNKADIEKAINKIKEELKNDIEKGLKSVAPITEAVKPGKADKKQKKVKEAKIEDEKAVEIDLDLNEEHLNILYNVAEETEEVSFWVLLENYKKVFPGKERKDFQVRVRELIENNMIREAYAASGDFFFTVTNQGLMHIRKKM